MLRPLKILILSAIIPAVALGAPYVQPENTTWAQGEALNTAQAWAIAKESHTLVGQLGLPLQTEERTLWASWEAGQIQTLPALAWGNGSVIYPLGLTIPVLQTSPGNFSVIVLNRGAVPSKVLGAPGTQWIVRNSVAGHHAIVAVKPRLAGLHSNLQIFATGPQGQLLTYTVGLVSGKHRYTPELSFYRDTAPNPQRIPLEPLTPSAHTVFAGVLPNGATPSASPAPKVVASRLSVNWKMECAVGNCAAMMPVTVANTDTQTFVRFQHPQKSAPMVLPETRQGKSWYAPSHLVAGGKTLVVDADPWRLDLLHEGAHGQMAEIRLTQKSSKEAAQ